MTDVEMYLDWVNNFLTLDRFCEYYELTPNEASMIIYRGRNEHEAGVEAHKASLA